MIAITEILSAEHRVFTELFDQIEGLLPKLTTLPEVKLLTTLVEGLLQGHADAERNLAYVALDHALKDRGRLDRLHQDHEEIDASLKRAQTAHSFEEARRLLKTSISASREHFRREEGSIFPLLERVLRPETLATLGTARVQPDAAPVNQTPPR
jgi:hemerythrin-like domain-containing protein